MPLRTPNLGDYVTVMGSSGEENLGYYCGIDDNGSTIISCGGVRFAANLQNIKGYENQKGASMVYLDLNVDNVYGSSQKLYLSVDAEISDIFDEYMEYRQGNYTSTKLIAYLDDLGHNTSLLFKTPSFLTNAMSFGGHKKVKVVHNNRVYEVASLEEFNKHTNPDANLAGKFVKFVYKGGSNPGTSRTILVDSITKEFITGSDVVSTMKAGGKQEYRKYLRNKIVGKLQEVSL